MINYNHIKIKGNIVRVEVKLEGKLVGSIRPLDGKWAYVPKGGRAYDQTFSTIQGVKDSLVSDKEEDQTPKVPDFTHMNFMQKVQANFYDNPLSYAENKGAYRAKGAELHELFMGDLKTFMIAEGVPTKYVAKAVAYAYDQGHSSGYSEVTNFALHLIEIFS